ncbi:hypothetical protein BN990_03192 [Virgibacillus salexigens]|uniref:Uncharacterized protein n=1 Tax=Virgibacillus massiliensis TaxID=1462526 RepID=A0A024QEC9_9BACI|nr:hypothetical protein BN990_03192 [Virgibacillus massiliensis]
MINLQDRRDYPLNPELHVVNISTEQAIELTYQKHKL